MPVSTVNFATLHPHTIQTLVDTVTDAVTRRFTASLPTIAGAQPSPDPPLLDSLATPPIVPVTTTPTSVVKGAVTAAHSQITGQPEIMMTTSVSHTPSQLFTSTSIAIDAQISAKIKAKIWAEEFVDFGSLLGNPRQDRYHLAFRQSEDGVPTAVFEPITKKKELLP